MFLVLSHIVNNSGSNLEGLKLFEALENAIRYDDDVILVVDNDASLSSSFLNSSIGLFLEKYGMDFFKGKIRFKGSKNQFKRISKYLEKFSSVYSC